MSDITLCELPDSEFDCINENKPQWFIWGGQGGGECYGWGKQDWPHNVI